MSRAVGWVSNPSDIVKSSIRKAERSSFFIIRELGPTSFTIKDSATVREQQAEGGGGSSANRIFKITIGSINSCSCVAFRNEKAICRHICWLLLKKFRIPSNHPFAYQAGFVAREIEELLAGTHIKKEITEERPPSQANQNELSSSEAIRRRDISADEVCPICQEELLEARLPITWCRGCSNAAHIRCMKVWSEHQETINRSAGDSQSIMCPYCRQEFAPKEQLRREFSNTWESRKQRDAIHERVACAECSITPIKGRLYIGIRPEGFGSLASKTSNLHLCGQCYRGGAKPNMKFNFRERPGQSLKAAKRVLQNQNLVLELQGREISENDYESLLHLDRPPSPDAPGIPEHVLNLIPCHRVGANRRLLREGEQCRICLLQYEPSQYVKKLQKCNHYFHRDCLDTWLQNHRECPIDGIQISIRQKTPRKISNSLTNVIENRTKSLHSAKGRLLSRKQSRETHNNLIGSFSDLLVTRPMLRPNEQIDVQDEDIEEIRPRPFRMNGTFRIRPMKLSYK